MSTVYRAKRDRTYRAFFTKTDATKVALDFYAENLSLAIDHARKVAGDIATHKEVGPLALVRVNCVVNKEDFRTGDAGSFYPVN